MPGLLGGVSVYALPSSRGPNIDGTFVCNKFLYKVLSLVYRLTGKFVPICLNRGCLSVGSLPFMPILITPIFKRTFPFLRGRGNNGTVATSFKILLNLFPRLRPTICLTFFFVFFSIMMVVGPRSLESVLAFNFFTFGILLAVGVTSVRVNYFVVTKVIVCERLVGRGGKPMGVDVLRRQWL